VCSAGTALLPQRRSVTWWGSIATPAARTLSAHLSLHQHLLLLLPPRARRPVAADPDPDGSLPPHPPVLQASTGMQM
jgi:hypothetical protein